MDGAWRVDLEALARGLGAADATGLCNAAFLIKTVFKRGMPNDFVPEARDGVFSPSVIRQAYIVEMRMVSHSKNPRRSDNPGHVGNPARSNNPGHSGNPGQRSESTNHNVVYEIGKMLAEFTDEERTTMALYLGFEGDYMSDTQAEKARKLLERLREKGSFLTA